MGAGLLVVVVMLATASGTRLITGDSWPPTLWLRRTVRARYGKGHPLDDLTHCPWCVSPYVGAVVCAATAWTVGLPAPVLVWAATRYVVGLVALNLDVPPDDGDEE